MATRDILYAAAGGSAAPTYVEDVFSTYLYTGNGSTQTITNNIDLAGKGGLVWTKFRSGSFGSESHSWNDSARGTTNYISSDTNGAQINLANSVTGFISSGYTLGADATGGKVNYSAQNYCSWTFRKQAKFFDVVTYTGNGTSGTVISHNLGSVPGMIILKNTTTGTNWVVHHRSVGFSQYLQLNTTIAATTGSKITNSTSTNFTISAAGDTNNSGDTYVAYLFAHNAGGFGLTGTDNVISCGSYTNNSSAPVVVNLGYEPQYVLIKNITQTGNNWQVLDTMRGMSYGNMNRLFPNLSNAESSATPIVFPTATGFEILNGQSSDYNSTATTGTVTYIYMAIRRGPMATPTSGTSVFSPLAVTASSGTNRTTNFPVDLQISGIRGGGSSQAQVVVDRLRGVATDASSNPTVGINLATSSTAAETGASADFMSRGWGNTGFQDANFYNGQSVAYWNFRRAPGFFDIVCYTGTGSARTITHNLGVVPEMMIVKSRSIGTEAWAVYTAATGNTKYLRLNDPQAVVTNSGTPNRWNNTTPTASVFSVGTDPETNSSGATYVAYLFSTLAGVSKVGSYTGTGSTQTINCGFTTGARFVLIKRTDTTGDWFVWDTARGMVAGTDPYLFLNSTAAETNANTVFTTSVGFTIDAGAPTAVNANGGTFIYLAIA